MHSVVVGHFSVDNDVRAEHFCFTRTVQNVIECDEKQLYDELVSLFSFEGGNVIDGTHSEGIVNV